MTKNFTIHHISTYHHETTIAYTKVIQHHTISNHMTNLTIRHIIPYQPSLNNIILPYHTIPYHTIPYHTIPYHTIPYHTIPYHTIPYHTIPYHTIPYHTIPYHTIPYHTIPYHIIPYTVYHNHTISCQRTNLTINGIIPYQPYNNVYHTILAYHITLCIAITHTPLSQSVPHNQEKTFKILPCLN